MSSVYTELAKKRVEQSKEAVASMGKTLPQSMTQNPHLPPTQTVTVKKAVVRPKKYEAQSPSLQRPVRGNKNLADGKTQMSAVVTYEQKAVVLDLESKFNRREKVVGKGDIAGIGLDAVSRILNRPTPLFSSLQEIKDYVNKIIDKAIET